MEHHGTLLSLRSCKFLWPRSLQGGTGIVSRQGSVSREGMGCAAPSGPKHLPEIHVHLPSIPAFFHAGSVLRCLRAQLLAGKCRGAWQTSANSTLNAPPLCKPVSLAGAARSCHPRTAPLTIPTGAQVRDSSPSDSGAFPECPERLAR